MDVSRRVHRPRPPRPIPRIAPYIPTLVDDTDQATLPTKPMRRPKEGRECPDCHGNNTFFDMHTELWYCRERFSESHGYPERKTV